MQADFDKSDRLDKSQPPDNRPQANSHENEKEYRVPFWEWVVAIVGLALVAGLIGFIIYEGINGKESPPDVTVRVDSVIPTGGGYLVQIRAINRGGSTVAGLTVEGELKKGSRNLETSEITIDYVPSYSERKGGLFFKRDPRKFKLQVRAMGYEEP